MLRIATLNAERGMHTLVFLSAIRSPGHEDDVTNEALKIGPASAFETRCSKTVDEMTEMRRVANVRVAKSVSASRLLAVKSKGVVEIEPLGNTEI